MPSFLIFQFFFILIYHHALCAEATNTRKNLIVEFNPYVSILDRYDQNIYNISELLPMFAKVATEFDHVLIDLIGALDRTKLIKFPPDLSSSLLVAPLAAAQYNAHRNSSQPKLEVWLALSYISGDYNVINVSRHLKYIAEKANDIYEGTVTTILLEYAIMEYNEDAVKIMRNEKVFQASVFKRDYKWGVIIENSECKSAQDTSKAEKLRELKVNIAVIKVDVQNLHSNLTSDCKPYKANSNLTFWLKPQDTNKDDIISISEFLEQWTRIQKFSEHNDMPVVVSSAFDADGGRNGWWRLKENSDYSSTSEYIFEAKKDIAKQFDREANSMNLELVAKNEQILTKEHVGIRFLIETLTPTEIQAGCVGLDSVFKEVIASYSKIVIIFFGMHERYIADGLNCVARYFLKTMDIFFDIPYYVKLNGKTIDLIRSIHVQSSPKTNLTFIMDWTSSKSNDNYKLLRNQSGWHTKISIAFPISLCAEFQGFTTVKKRKVVELLEMSDMALFKFREGDESLALGVDQMFQQRLVTFAQCGKFLNKMKSSNSSIGKVQMGFLMTAYKLPSKYYENANALYNFVVYWDKLREWAVKKETTVIMSDVLDKALPENVNLGWWRRQSQNEIRKGNSSHQWIDKRTDLFLHPDVVILRMNKSRKRAEDGSRNSEYSTSQVAAFSVSVCLAIFFLISIPICFLAHRYYKRKYLTSSEMNDFFRGNQNSNDATQQSKLPYDKSKFEIGPKSFSIVHSRVLGSGEFGMVCPGTVEKSDGELVDVAVKMVNTNKYHKSALTGLVSEIKVLAHVGKHENIIELLGAYTADLKRGKIFVFLELGQCGSLEKYLRNLSPQPNANDEGSSDEDGIESAEMQTLVNSAEALMEPISDDLYRWSREICSGMAYLASKHVVHADLATRNVLLNAEKTAKICDFGLSRRMYNYANYVKQSQEPLPWKWMSPESLRLMEFNEKTDVWSYGVTLWEIYSLGDIPFQGISFDPNFSGMLERGFRMSKPKYNDRNMYSMMMKCWTTNPLGRPTFDDLLLLFDSGDTID